MLIKRASIDPGKMGGFATFEGNVLTFAGRMDAFTVEGLYRHLSGCTEIIIERAQAAPRQGISTAFEYGRTFGQQECVAKLTGANIFYVAPQWWKARLNLSEDKKLSLRLARQLYGDKYLKREGDEGVAEAILLGKFLLDELLYDQLIVNNEAREKKATKKRVQYRL